jgi:hypothetical protein
VFLTDEGSARIMDFGIAFWTSSGGTSRTVLGTVGYMSPEQVRGERVDGRSDLFSVGSLFCELLTGRRPFDGETPMATFYRIARGEATIELPPGPEHAGLLPVLRRALAPALEERYPNAGEFATALRAWAKGGVAPEATAMATERAPAAPGARVETTPPEALAGTAPERRPLPAHGVVGETPARRADPSGLFRLLREIYVGGKSGHLHLAVAGERKSLRILRGQIIHGTSDTAGEHMGDVLVRYGLLSQADLDRAVAIVLSERRRLGAVLGELGLLERSRIEEAVGLHAREILFNVLGRADVSCTFEELADSLMETDLVCPLSTGQLILEATRRILDPELVRTVLGDLGRVLILSPDPLLRSQKITLTPADGFVLSRVDGSSSARDILALVPLPAEDAERSLFSLLCTGIVGYRQQTPSAARAAARATARPARPVAPVPTPPPAPVVTPPPPAASRYHRVPVSPVSSAEPGGRRSGCAQRRGNPCADPRTASLKRDTSRSWGSSAPPPRPARGLRRLRVPPDACRTYRGPPRETGFIRLSQAYETLIRSRANTALRASKLHSTVTTCPLSPGVPFRLATAPASAARTAITRTAITRTATARAGPRARARRVHRRPETEAGTHPGGRGSAVRGRAVLGSHPAAGADDPEGRGADAGPGSDAPRQGLPEEPAVEEAGREPPPVLVRTSETLRACCSPISIGPIPPGPSPYQGC